MGLQDAKGGAATDAGIGVYGDGSDGTQTFDGTSVVLGITPSSSVYTLARDIFLLNGTINSGVRIKENGFRIFDANVLTNNGIISWNGLDASGTNGVTGGAVTGNTNSSFNAGAGSQSVGTAGANGGTGNGGNGGTPAAGSIGFGATGGTGGTGAASTAGTGGTPRTLPATDGSIRSIPTAILLQLFTGSQTLAPIVGGTGGGAGGGDATNNGGGGGAGGGIVGVYARTITGTGAIQARGGAGGTITVSTLGCGGGGGGGGGLVVVVSQSVVNGAIAGQTIDAAGGAAGAGKGTTFGAASPGAAGTVILLGN